MCTGNYCVIQCQSFGGGIIRNRTGNAFAGNVAGIGIGAGGMALITYFQNKKKKKLQEVTTDGE